MKQVEFAEYFAIPVRTIQEWEHDRRTPPEYLIRLLEYRLRIEGLIGKDGGSDEEKNSKTADRGSSGGSGRSGRLSK